MFLQLERNQELILKELAILKGLFASQSPSALTGSKPSVSLVLNQTKHIIRSYQPSDVHLPAKVQRLGQRGGQCIFDVPLLRHFLWKQPGFHNPRRFTLFTTGDVPDI